MTFLSIPQTLALLNGDGELLAVSTIAAASITAVVVAIAVKNRKSCMIQEAATMYYTGSVATVRRQGDSAGAGKIHPISVFWFMLLLLVGTASLIAIAVTSGDDGGSIFAGLGIFAVCLIAALVFLTCLKVADQWDRVVVLRLGKFLTVHQAGVFWLVPFVDTVAKWIDTRVQSTDLLAEQTLTKDTVPVDVDAVMFWLVYDPRKASLEVENFESAVTWAAQTALRDLIGKTMLADLLVGRDVLDKQLQEIIDLRTEPWGATVQSVEIREIKIPPALQDTMSRQAQAERERQARVILGESEEQIAQSFARASEMYRDNPTALHLRAMNMLFEGLKEKGSMMIIPSSALDSMNMGAIGGLASMAQQSAAAAGSPGTPPVV